jgi:hypothetical protein
MEEIIFSGKWTTETGQLPSVGAIFMATVNDKPVSCRVTKDALEDIDPANRMASSEEQFQQNQYELQNIAERLIRAGRINNGILTITSQDVR